MLQSPQFSWSHFLSRAVEFDDIFYFIVTRHVLLLHNLETVAELIIGMSTKMCPHKTNKINARIIVTAFIIKFSSYIMLLIKTVKTINSE